MSSDSNFVDPILKTNETPVPKAKPTFKVRIDPNHNNPTTLKDISDQINALQRSVAYVISRLSRLDYLATRERERGWS
jgi:hypothetical protein